MASGVSQERLLSSRRRHTRYWRDWSSDVCSSDLRTVRRYILQLQDLGIPVEAGRGRYGAYRLCPGYKLPPLMFSENEAIALTLGLLAARQLKLESSNLAVEGALAKVMRVMPQALRERVQAVQEALTIEQSPSASPEIGRASCR